MHGLSFKDKNVVARDLFETQHYNILLNPSDILAIQNRVEKLTFLLPALNLKIFISINKQITIISIIMGTQTKFSICFTKINTKFFLL